MSSELESKQNSYLFGGNAPYVEELYESYLDNPGSVSDRWRSYFDQLQNMPATDGTSSTRDMAHAPIVESFALKFAFAGKTIVFSGDTTYFPPLADFAREIGGDRVDGLPHPLFVHSIEG